MEYRQRVEKAQRFLVKQELLGVAKLKIEIDDNRQCVALSRVADGTGRIEVPDFVNEIWGGAFARTHYNEIVILGKVNYLGMLIKHIESKRVKVVYRGDIKNLALAFSCTGLEEIDLSEFNFSHVTEAERLFIQSPNLKKIVFPKQALHKVRDISYAFFGCGIQELDCNEVFGPFVNKIEQCFEESSIRELDFRNLSTLVGKFDPFRVGSLFPDTLEVLRMHEVSIFWEEHWRSRGEPHINRHLSLKELYLDKPHPTGVIVSFLKLIGQKEEQEVLVHNGNSQIMSIKLG